MGGRKDLKILLLQIRDNQNVRNEEHQSFKYKNKPLWAFQFHPEVDRETLVKRLTIFSKHYTDNTEQLKEVLDSAVETPESNILLGNIVERVLL